MKRIALYFAAAFAVALAACQKQEAPAAFSGKQVLFTTAQTDTRTEFGTKEGNKYPVLWNKGDELVVSLVSKYSVEDSLCIVPTFSTDRKGFTFSGEFTTTAEQDAFVVFYPSNAVKTLSNTNKTCNFEIPATQTPLATGPDPAAQMLWARHEFTTLPEKVELGFQHITAYGRLSFKNLALGNAAIKYISIASEEDIVGRYFIFAANASKDGVEYATGDIIPNVPGGNLIINTASSEGVWFAVKPADLSGKELKMVVSTDKGTFTKTVTVPAGHAFEAGKVTRIEVDMAGIPLVAPIEYKKIADVAELAEGDEIILYFPTDGANKVSDFYAFSTSQKGNNRQAIPVEFNGTSAFDPAEAVERIVLEKGATDGTFYLRALGEPGYLYAAATGSSSNNYLRTSPDGNYNGNPVADFAPRRSWTITLNENGYANIVSQLSTLKSWACVIQFNDTNLASNPIISCYKKTATNPVPAILRKVK